MTVDPAIRERVLAFLATVTRPGRSLETLSDDQDLVAEGLMDSLGVIQIILHLEQEHGVSVRPDDVDPAALMTLGGILRLIERTE